MLHTPEIEAAVLEALRPRSMADRVRGRLAGGLTVAQVCERLPAGVREALEAGETNPTAARLRASDALGGVLRAMAARGALRRAKAMLRLELGGGKGPRNVEVDVFRLP